MTSSNPFDEFIGLYRDKPALFVEEVLGCKPFDYQVEFLNELVKPTRRLSIRSGHGTGKTCSCAWAMIWILLFQFPCKVIVTAPTSAQLFDGLFNEVKKWINELPPQLRSLLNVKSDRVEFIPAPTEAFISARTARAETPEALAGVHNEAGFVYIICDESSGISEAVFEAAAGSMSSTNCKTILISNPTRVSGTFYESQTRQSDKWWTRKWSCLDSPLVSDEFVEEMKHRYGPESAAFSIRVLGEFAKADIDTIIPYELVDAAMGRDIAVDEHQRTIWALDPARFGDARTALVKRTGSVVTEVMSWRGLDTMQTIGRVMAEYEALPESQQPAEILIDEVGLGGPIVDRMRQLVGDIVRGVNVSESPSSKGVYNNLRSELWFKAKAWFESRTCKVPKNEELLADLTAITYTFSASGKMQAETKDSMRKRGLRSPDLADALCLSFASDEITMLRGPMRGWDGPLRRNLAGIV